jgi:hypothetical protein
MNFCWGKISELVPRVDEWFSVLEDYVEKQLDCSGINEGHLML